MEFIEREIKGIYEIVLRPFEDERGLFARSFDENVYLESSIPNHWVQENISRNFHKGIIRGLHFLNKPFTDGKLLRCSRGKIWDVAVDLRKGSDTIGQYLVTVLTEDELKWLYIPKGFAHGFCTLTDHSELIYKHDAFYEKSADSGIRWDDRDIDIDWPAKKPMLSEKDSKLMSYNDFILKFEGL